MARPKDEYANVAEVSVTDSGGAGTVVFTELSTGISLGQGSGIIIDAFEYTPGTAALAAMDNDSDYIGMAWTTSNSVDNLTAGGYKQIIHRTMLVRTDSGTAGDSHFHEMPFKFDMLPPIIVAAPRIYGAVQSNLGAVSLTYNLRMYYRYVDLSTKEYLEIAESFVLVG